MDPTNRTTTGTELRGSGSTEPLPSSSADPRHYRVDERLLDGRPVILRAIRPEDRDALRAGFHRLSERSVYLRFFQAKRELTDQELHYLTEIDFESHVALLAILEHDGEEEGIGVGRYIVEPGTEAAEIAFVVDEAHHGLGVGTLLLRHLAAIARAKGLEKFHAYVMFDNRAMLEVFEHAGFPMERRLQGNVIKIVLSLRVVP
jgi:GNAT superfamily N-acetyltransferase